MQCARAILPSVACSVPRYVFYILSYRWHYLGKLKSFEHKMCFDFLYSFSWDISHSKNTERDMIKNDYLSSCELPDFFQILIRHGFYRQIFEKIIKYQTSWKSLQLKSSCSMRAEGRIGWQTDRRSDRHDEALSRFPQFLESC